MSWLLENIVSIFPLSYKRDEPIIPLSVNYFPHRQCNYACQFCFHTTKNLEILPLEDAKRGLRMLADQGMKKLNISGGEPFLKPQFIGEVFRFCKEELGLESCSVVNNGSRVNEKWLDEYGQYLDVMAISCDSFEPETNVKQGRTENGRRKDHISRVFEVAQWCRERGIKVKINSVITANNWEEDMNEQIKELAPERWKVFQVLLLEGENTGESSLRDARSLVITDEQFKYFLERHQGQTCLVPESNEAMKDSYLNLDEKMRFLNCESGGKVPGRSILDVGVQEALKDSGWNEQMFVHRGGVFDWSRETGRAASEPGLDW
ncbi:hypothetical protein CVT24_011291 [Panaeolus cyanescens]|uniref:Radical SAM core domain-containing protein n=1 Tax=Panaeolus cyanescens TaxID=181874 RepID=A0A409YUU2_9AGAR|nr:hypothetical protein CVT24_011291 [Panaeolus cyanescens]